MRHTPGPWITDQDQRVVTDEAGEQVCTLWERLQRDENARLIAAASELLGELARALRYIETPGDFQPREHAEIVDDLSALLARITTP